MKLSGLARALSSNPAKVMGLYPRKGAIKPGSDADLAIIDPAASAAVDFRKLQHKTDYSPYQGVKLHGWAKYTILRGEMIAEEGKLSRPDRPAGQFLRRKKSAMPEVVKRKA